MQLTLNNAGRVRCEPGWQLRPEWARRLKDYDLWFVWAGRGQMLLSEGRRLDLRPGVCLWMRPGRRYEATQDASDRLGVSFIHFDATFEAHDDSQSLPAEVHQIADVAYVDAVLRRVVQIHGSNHAVASQLFRGLVLDIVSGLGQPDHDGQAGTAQHHRRAIGRVTATIDDDPTHAPPVDQLARQAGYSPDHFTRVFGQVTGQSPQQYILRRRINRAQNLLIESSLTVSQIANALGYDNVYFFSRQFKQKTGQTPTQFRQGSG